MALQVLCTVPSPMRPSTRILGVALLMAVFAAPPVRSQANYKLVQSIVHDSNLDRTSFRISDTVSETWFGALFSPSESLHLSVDGTYRYGLGLPARSDWTTTAGAHWQHPLTAASRLKASLSFSGQDFRGAYRVYRNLNGSFLGAWSFQQARPGEGRARSAEVSLQVNRSDFPNLPDFSADTLTLLAACGWETPRWLFRLEAEGGHRRYVNSYAGTRRLMWAMMGHDVLGGAGGGGCGGTPRTKGGGMMAGMSMFGPGSRYMAQIGRTGDSDALNRAAARMEARWKVSDAHFAGLAAEWLAEPGRGYRYSTYTSGTVTGRSEFLDDAFGYSGGTVSGSWNAFWPRSWQSRMSLSYERRDYPRRPVLDPVLGMPTGKTRSDRIRWGELELERGFFPDLGGREVTLTAQAYLRTFSRSSTDPYFAGTGSLLGVSIRLGW